MVRSCQFGPSLETLAFRALPVVAQFIFYFNFPCNLRHMVCVCNAKDVNRHGVSWTTSEDLICDIFPYRVRAETTTKAGAA